MTNLAGSIQTTTVTAVSGVRVPGGVVHELSADLRAALGK